MMAHIKSQKLNDPSEDFQILHYIIVFINYTSLAVVAKIILVASH